MINAIIWDMGGVLIRDINLIVGDTQMPKIGMSTDEFAKMVFCHPLTPKVFVGEEQVKSHFQLKQSQARVNVSARHRELFNTELGLYGLPEHRQMTVTFDPTQTWFDVEQCRGYPTVAL